MTNTSGRNERKLVIDWMFEQLHVPLKLGSAAAFAVITSRSRKNINIKKQQTHNRCYDNSGRWLTLTMVQLMLFCCVCLFRRDYHVCDGWFLVCVSILAANCLAEPLWTERRNPAHNIALPSFDRSLEEKRTFDERRQLAKYDERISGCDTGAAVR